MEKLFALNGWQRLWILGSAVLGLVAAWRAVEFWTLTLEGDGWDLLRSAALVWVVVVVVLLAIGAGLSWALRGFKTQP